MSQVPEDEVRRWVEHVVVGLNLCPFAKRELDADRVRFVVSGAEGDGNDADLQRLQELAREYQILDSDDEVATTLVIYPRALQSFDAYLDFLALAEEELVGEGHEGRYQLASFHPQYRFAESAEDDAANYTNRSPYPILHILREEQLALAIASHPDPAQIPLRNKEVCRTLGIVALSALMKD